MNKTLKMTIFLAVVAALATGLLAAVNQMTAPVIAANDASAQTAELEQLYPDATNFEMLEFTPDENGLVKEAYAVDDTAHVFKVESKGYEDIISFLIGYDNDGSNSKFAILQNSETPGFGQRLSEDAYIDSMQGKTTGDAAEVVSGATSSSNAVVNGVNAAVSVFNDLTGSTATPSAPAEPEPAGATIVETLEEGTSTVYLVEAEGFSGTNVVRVQISEAGLVESVSFEEFNDSDFEGKPARDEAWLALFEGLDVTGEIDVDTSTGATYSSDSVLEAVKAASSAHTGEGGQEETSSTTSVLEVREDGTYVIESEGFAAKNIVLVKISDDGIIESVSFEEFNDSDFEGKPARDEAWLALFEGLDVTGEIDVDTSTGATYSSDSVLEAVKKAAEEFGGQ